MRTKALLGLAVLAASAATCLAQGNVYSLNIVGYVNVPVQGDNKLTLISNPLKPSNGDYGVKNTIVLPETADGAAIFAWGGTTWASTVPQWVGIPGGSFWDPNYTNDLGDSFFIQSPVATSITFVGEVQTGTTNAPINYNLAPGLNFVAPKTPVAQAFPGKDIGNDGDAIYQWTGSAWAGTVFSYLGGVGWDDGSGNVANLDGPQVPVGGGVVYNNTGAALNWTRVFDPNKP
jgi:hypothetical protein